MMISNAWFSYLIQGWRHNETFKDVMIIPKKKSEKSGFLNWRHNETFKDVMIIPNKSEKSGFLNWRHNETFKDVMIIPKNRKRGPNQNQI